MVERLLFQVVAPIDYQQHLDMVALQSWKDFIIDEVVWDSTKEKWHLFGVGEGEMGMTPLHSGRGSQLSLKTPFKKVTTKFF